MLLETALLAVAGMLSLVPPPQRQTECEGDYAVCSKHVQYGKGVTYDAMKEAHA